MMLDHHVVRPSFNVETPYWNVEFVRHVKICPRVTKQPKWLRNKMKETNEIKT